MTSLPERPDRLQLRVGDTDRHQVAEILRQAAGEGRIDLDELDERLEATFKAKTYADLLPVTLDLPVKGLDLPAAASLASTGSASRVPAVGTPEKHLAIMGGFERKGVWTVPAEMQILAIMGGANLDLREAVFAAPVAELTVNAVMGGVNLIVPQGVRVIFSMVSVMGGHNDDKGSTAGADAPTLLIKGFCLMGGVNVERKG